MRRFLLLSSAIILIFSPAALADEHPLNPRIDTGLKLGTERGIVTTEIWVPVRQAPDRVLYGDARLTGDDHDNFEGNLGGGYRHIYGDAIFGAHAWIDRRKTARGSTFHQATVGVEALGRDFDARLNAYVPLSGSKTYATPNMGRAEPYLAGSGVFYDTTGQLVEEPQGGFDIELGARVPLFEQRVDSIRVYGGGYHFGGDETPDVTGWRARVSADVTPQLQLGARFQKDAARGSQGFLEATLRFPGKASFRREGLRARLDESPERDIDIVTGAAVTDSGIGKPVLNETGNPQRVLHVDNTNGDAGEGTKENPYATLKAAEAAMKPYDVIYVRQGDGTTTGQTLGIVIDKPNVQMIGSGVDLVYAGGRVTGAAAGTSTGTVLAAATAAPVITNTQASIGDTTGNGVLVTADAGLITGLSASASQLDGIRFLADGYNSVIESATVRDVISNSNNGRGILAWATNNGHIGTVSISGITAMQNTGTFGRGVEMRSSGSGTISNIHLTDITASLSDQEGVRVYALSSGQIGAVNLQDITATGNGQHGVLFQAVTSGTISTADLQDITASSNANEGVYIQANGAGSAVTTVNISDVSANANVGRGVFVYAFGGGTISTADLQDITATSNAVEGVNIQANGAGSTITAANISGVTSQNNMGGGGRGFVVQAQNSGQISTASLQDIHVSGNSSHGMWVYALSGGQIGTAELRDVIATSNGNTGVRVEANGAGSVISASTVSGGSATSNTNHGVLVYAQNSGQIGAAELQDIVATTNGLQGFYLLGQTNGILSALLEDVTATGNTVNGVFVDDDTTGAFTVDLGGGALGSIGGSRIYANTDKELRVDLDGGQLKAENNWWGNAAGLLPARVTLDAGGNTVDADPFLAADPGP